MDSSAGWAPVQAIASVQVQNIRPPGYSISICGEKGQNKMWSGGIIAAVLLIGALCAPSAVRAAEWFGIRAETGFTADDNVTRARSGSDKLSDQSFSVDLGKDLIVPVSEHTRLALLGFLGTERFLNHSGLSRVYFGAQGEYQYRTSGDFFAPTFSIFGRTSVDEYESNLRDGYRYSFGVNLRQSLTDKIHLFGALTQNTRDGKSTVFDTRDRSARLNLDYSISRNSTVYLGGEYRYGDVVSTARPALADVDIADAIVRDDVFTDTARFSYRVRANTILTTLGYNLAFDPKHSLDFSWRWVQSDPTRAPGFATPDKIRYTVNQLSVFYLFRF
jgi:hypothetical protein